MDCAYFLNQRTQFVSDFYDTSIQPFNKMKTDIENEIPPFDNFPYGESNEPAFMKQWGDADTSIKLIGMMALCLISESLKIYISCVSKNIGFSLDEKAKKVRNKRLFSTFKKYFGAILKTHWVDCSFDDTLLNEIIVARNSIQHNDNLHTFLVQHTKHTLQKTPQPFFAKESQLQAFDNLRSYSTVFRPHIVVDRDKLNAAISALEGLADWIDTRSDKIAEWRGRKGTA
jgi:hypothetical protein